MEFIKLTKASTSREDALVNMDLVQVILPQLPDDVGGSVLVFGIDDGVEDCIYVTQTPEQIMALL